MASKHFTSFGPLLQIKDNLHNTFQIEIICNKVVDLYNSQLIRTYSLLDSRFHRLALLLKSWNKSALFQKSQRLNSYSIVLMLIAFL